MGYDRVEPGPLTKWGFHVDAGGSPAIDSVCCPEASVWLLAA